MVVHAAVAAVIVVGYDVVIVAAVDVVDYVDGCYVVVVGVVIDVLC